MWVYIVGNCCNFTRSIALVLFYNNSCWFIRTLQLSVVIMVMVHVYNAQEGELDIKTFVGNEVHSHLLPTKFLNIRATAQLAEAGSVTHSTVST